MNIFHLESHVILHITCKSSRAAYVYHQVVIPAYYIEILLHISGASNSVKYSPDECSAMLMLCYGS